MESQLRALVKAVEQVTKQRQGTRIRLLKASVNKFIAELSVAAGEFAQSVSDLAEADIGEDLSASLAGLAEMERKYQEMQTGQSEQDMITFLSTGELISLLRINLGDDISIADEYTRLISSVRVRYSISLI
jgi:sorting nexin-1/2